MSSDFILGLWLSLLGVGVVAGALGLLMLSVQLLKYFFKTEEERQNEAEKPEPEDTEELLASAPPDEIMAVIAVEHHRRKMTLGSKLEESASKKYTENG